VTNIPAPGIDPPDRIELRGLRALGIHGVLAEERNRAQPFEVDIDLEVDLRQAGRSDDLTDTIDYGAVAEAVVAAIAGPPANLLETLAERIANAACQAADTGSPGSGPELPKWGPDRTDPSIAAPDPTGPARLRVLSSPRPAIVGVTVSVRKLRPPVGVDMTSAGVRIHRYPDQLGGSSVIDSRAGDH
jgi:7,8-dihydroneopterin aldolase/epimerase/oxygenase